MNKPTIYLAGAMSGVSYEEYMIWRNDAAKLLQSKSDKSLHIINPGEYYNFEMNEGTYTEHEVKYFDLYCVKHSDLVLVNLTYHDSIGTAIEIHEAHDNWGIPVIGFCPNDTRHKVYPMHPWMKLSLTKECKTLEAAVDYICEFYLPNL